MFYTKQTIHNPDSPRNMNTESWLAGKSLRVAHRHIEGAGTFTDIDLSKMETDIAHGFIKVIYNTRDNIVTFTFKHEPGVYKQYGFESGYIEVPLPELYITGQFETIRREGKMHAHFLDIQVGSHHVQLLPLSNLYESGPENWNRIEYSAGRKIYYRRVCDEGVLAKLVGGCDTVVEILNRLSTQFTTYLLTGGNTDLSLGCRLYGGQITGENIADIIADEFGYDTRSKEYRMYWCFLNAGLKHFSPEEIYDKLQECRYVRDCLRALNVTYADIQKVSEENDKSNHKVINY